MAEDADVQAPEITPEGFMADEQASPKAESSPVKETKPEAAAEEAKEPAKAESEVPEATDTDTDKPAEPAAETEPETPQGEDKPLAPKSENRFQQLANENRTLKDQVKQLTEQVYQPQSADELTDTVNPQTGENYTRAEAAVAALEQKLELRDYQDRVTGSQVTLGNESFQVLNDFAWANPDNDSYDEELAMEAAELLEVNLIRDPNVPEIGPDGKPTGQGLIIGSNISPYKLYKTLDRASGISATKGQLKGQKATETMLANADTASSAAPPKQKADPLKELWDEPL